MIIRNFYEGILGIRQKNEDEKLGSVSYLVFIFWTGDLHILNIRPQKQALSLSFLFKKGFCLSDRSCASLTRACWLLSEETLTITVLCSVKSSWDRAAAATVQQAVPPCFAFLTSLPLQGRNNFLPLRQWRFKEMNYHFSSHSWKVQCPNLTMDRTARQGKGREDLNDTVNRHLQNTPSNNTDHTFFPSAQGTPARPTMRPAVKQALVHLKRLESYTVCSSITMEGN